MLSMTVGWSGLHCSKAAGQLNDGQMAADQLHAAQYNQH